MIRSELDVLLDKVQDPALRADLRSQIDRLKQRRSFGLVFEQHIPERVRLPQHPIRVGSQVVSRENDDSPTFEVILIDDEVATLVQVRDADGAYVPRSEHGLGGQERAPVDSLVVISDFGEPVLPGFRHLGSVERGGDKPYHVVIKGENHHALEALRFTHAGRVDCIYIDPPYNSGARDWKYNNDYVDDSDAYRHSKWLAFMERRLRLAKELLNPDDSVLIVTIDEKEYLRLGLLLAQVFSGCRIQMVTSIVNPRAGVARPDAFTRVDEYLFYVLLGNASIQPATLSAEISSTNNSAPIWFSLMRTGSNSSRQARPNLFYPVWVHPDGRLHSIGESIPIGADRKEMAFPASGLHAVWPLRPDGSENTWQLGPRALRAAFTDGSAKVGQVAGRFSISYLRAAEKRRVDAGEIEVVGRDERGALVLRHREGAIRLTRPRTVWASAAHDAGLYGSSLLRTVIPNRSFPFPKSLYAVEDSLRFAVQSNPDAVILDFFAGSGTTAHAVARLNRQDGGRRQSIMITNNEVSADEANDLRSQGLRPGDPEWEALGIFEHVTRPRVAAAITGRTPEGAPIVGDYKFTDEFPMADGFEENVAFFELRYLEADDVDLGLAFDDVAALLWLRAGAEGAIAGRSGTDGARLPYVWAQKYGVLFDEDRWRRFVLERPGSPKAAFIVTYSPTAFAGITAELPTDMEVVRLPDSYLSMFLPDRGRA